MHEFGKQFIKYLRSFEITKGTWLISGQFFWRTVSVGRRKTGTSEGKLQPNQSLNLQWDSEWTLESLLILMDYFIDFLNNDENLIWNGNRLFPQKYLSNLSAFRRSINLKIIPLRTVSCKAVFETFTEITRHFKAIQGADVSKLI